MAVPPSSETGPEEAAASEAEAQERAKRRAAHAAEGDAARNQGGWGLWALPLVATVGVMVVALPPERPEEAARARVDTTDLAGDAQARETPAAQVPALRVYRGAPEGRVPLADGEEVQSGEALEVAYTAGGQSHGVILSIDGDGAVHRLWPAEPEGTTALDAGAEIRLATPWTVSKAPRFERLYFVAAALPLDVAVVRAAAQDLADNGLAPTALALPLQQQVQQATLLLTKPDGG